MAVELELELELGGFSFHRVSTFKAKRQSNIYVFVCLNIARARVSLAREYDKPSVSRMNSYFIIQFELVFYTFFCFQSYPLICNCLFVGAGAIKAVPFEWNAHYGITCDMSHRRRT